MNDFLLIIFTDLFDKSLQGTIKIIKTKKGDKP